MVKLAKNNLSIVVAISCFIASYETAYAALTSDQWQETRSVTCQNEGSNVNVTVNRPSASDLTINVTVHKPCCEECSTHCSQSNCFTNIDESLATPESLSHFTQLDGTWTQAGNHVNTIATSPSHFLQYNFIVDQAFEVLEVEIEFPFPQLANQPDCAGGLLSNWNGSHSNVGGPSVAFFNFATDNAGNITGTPSFKVDTFFGGSQTSVNFPLSLDTTYKLRLVKVGGQTVVYIDDVFILYSPNSGNAPGNSIGMWAFQAEANFKNFKSCSYTSTPDGFVVP